MTRQRRVTTADPTLRASLIKAALIAARREVDMWRTQIVRDCTVRGDLATLDPLARADVGRMDGVLAQIDRALEGA